MKMFYEYVCYTLRKNKLCFGEKNRKLFVYMKTWSTFNP